MVTTKTCLIYGMSFSSIDRNSGPSEITENLTRGMYGVSLTLPNDDKDKGPLILQLGVGIPGFTFKDLYSRICTLEENQKYSDLKEKINWLKTHSPVEPRDLIRETLSRLEGRIASNLLLPLAEGANAVQFVLGIPGNSPVYVEGFYDANRGAVAQTLNGERNLGVPAKVIYDTVIDGSTSGVDTAVQALLARRDQDITELSNEGLPGGSGISPRSSFSLINSLLKKNREGEKYIRSLRPEEFLYLRIPTDPLKLLK